MRHQRRTSALVSGLAVLLMTVSLVIGGAGAAEIVLSWWCHGHGGLPGLCTGPLPVATMPLQPIEAPSPRPVVTSARYSI